MSKKRHKLLRAAYRANALTGTASSDESVALTGTASGDKSLALTGRAPGVCQSCGREARREYRVQVDQLPQGYPEFCRRVTIMLDDHVMARFETIAGVAEDIRERIQAKP